MKKTLGQIAHDAGNFERQWERMGGHQQADWERIAHAVIAEAVPVPSPVEFDVEASLTSICNAYWEGPNVDQCADIDGGLLSVIRAELLAAAGSKA